MGARTATQHSQRQLGGGWGRGGGDCFLRETTGTGHHTVPMTCVWLLAGLVLLATFRHAATQSVLGAPKPPQRSDRWFVQGQAAMQDRIEKLQRRREVRAKNVILFVADGYGVTSNQATRLFAGQNNRVPSGVSATMAGADGLMVGADQMYGEEHILPAEDMPNLALSKTYNTNAQTPDSAGTASALNTGVKAKAGVISVREGARRGFCTDLGQPALDYSAADLGDSIAGTNLTETCAPLHPIAPLSFALRREDSPVGTLTLLQIRRDGEEGVRQEDWCASLALAPSPLIFSCKSEKSLCGTGAAEPTVCI